MIEEDDLPVIVLFDLDGTLLDNAEIVVETYYQGMIDLGYQPQTREVIAQQMGKSTVETAKGLGLKEDDWNKLDDWFWSYFGKYCQTTTDEINLITGAEMVIKALHSKKIPMGVVTSNSSENARLLLEKAGALHWFSAVIGKEDVNEVKPSAEPILKALKIMGIEPEKKLWMVGDSASDVYAARNAGITSVAIPLSHTYQRVIQAEPDMLVDSMSDLYQLLM